MNNTYEVTQNLRYEDGRIYPLLYKTKNGGLLIEIVDLQQHDKLFISGKVFQKILDNSGKPITIQKSSRKSQYDDAKPHKIMVYFPAHKLFKLYIGKPGRNIEKITEDVASNGEIQLDIDVNAVKILIEAIKVHEYAKLVAQEREDKRTDYLEDTVILPEGKFFDECKSENGDKEK